MTIKVVSNQPSDPVTPTSEAKESDNDSSASSASEASATDLNTSSKSGAEDTEAENQTDDDESDDASDKEAAAGADDSATDKPKKKGGYQRKLDKYRAQLTAAEQNAEYWRTEALARAMQNQTPDKAAASTVPAVDPDKPKAENFETHESWIEAVADWKADKKLAAWEQKQEQKKLEQVQAQARTAHEKRLESFSEEHDDFWDVVKNVDRMKIPFTAAIKDSVESSDIGPALMYELAKNPTEYARIAALAPAAAYREMGKLELRLSKASDMKPQGSDQKKTTKAPPPISPVGDKAAPSAKSLTDPTLSYKEFEALRMQQRASRANAWN